MKAIILYSTFVLAVAVGVAVAQERRLDLKDALGRDVVGMRETDDPGEPELGEAVMHQRSRAFGRVAAAPGARQQPITHFDLHRLRHVLQAEPADERSRGALLGRPHTEAGI